LKIWSTNLINYFESYQLASVNSLKMIILTILKEKKVYKNENYNLKNEAQSVSAMCL